MEAAVEKSRSEVVQIFRHGPIIIYIRLPAGGTHYPICMSPTNSERLIGISDAFSAFVYGYPSSCPRAHCIPNKSVTTLRYTRRHGPVYIYIQVMAVGTYRVQSPGFPKIVYCPIHCVVPPLPWYNRASCLGVKKLAVAVCPVLSCTLCCPALPWYNCAGWLGVKKQSCLRCLAVVCPVLCWLSAPQLWIINETW